MSFPTSSQGSNGEKSQNGSSEDNKKEFFGSPPANFNFWAIREKREDSASAKRLKLEEEKDGKKSGIKGLDLNRKYPLNLIIVGRRAITLSKDPSRYFLKFTGRDEEGTEISILVFDAALFEDCDKMMQMEDTVRISNYSLDSVSTEGLKYEPFKLQMRLHSKTLIEASSETIFSAFREFAKIKDVKTMGEGKSADILAMVVYKSDVQQFESKCQRILVLTDEVGEHIQFHLWNQEAVQFNGELGDHVAVLRGTVKTYNGLIIITATSQTTTWVKPSEDKLPGVKTLLEWFAEAVAQKEQAEKDLENSEESQEQAENSLASTEEEKI